MYSLLIKICQARNFCLYLVTAFISQITNNSTSLSFLLASSLKFDIQLPNRAHLDIIRAEGYHSDSTNRSSKDRIARIALSNVFRRSRINRSYRFRSFFTAIYHTYLGITRNVRTLTWSQMMSHFFSLSYCFKSFALSGGRSMEACNTKSHMPL